MGDVVESSYNLEFKVRGNLGVEQIMGRADRGGKSTIYDAP